MKRRYNVDVKRPWILPGSKILTSLSIMIQTFTKEHEDVVIQTPVYNMFEFVINQNNRKLVENPLINENGTYSMDLVHLENCFKSGAKLLVLCNPHNPVGRVWGKEEIRELVHLCKKYDVYLISDEIHADLIMENHIFYSVAHHNHDYEKIIIVNAPSKTFNLAGLQISNYVIPHNKTRNIIKKSLLKSFLGTPNLLAIEALKTAYTKCDDWLEAQNKHIYENYLLLRDFLNQNHEKIGITPLEGTYLVWLDVRYLNQSSEALLKHLGKYDIVLASGKAYGNQCEGYLRMNIACSKEQLLVGLNRFSKAINDL
ncbi:MAG: MalY/PatB family protein [Candidatus Izemoplasmataceae bacterium]